MSELVDLIREHSVERIIVGLPLETSGREGPQAEEVRRFGEALQRRSDLPVVYWDERLTSARARREIHRMNLPESARREKERVDAMAAMFILQGYLDAQGKG
jgi:putative Holliday junction resolvase